MNHYQFKAANSKGEFIEEKLLAASKEEALKILDKRGLTPLSLKESHSPFQLRSSINQADLIEFTRGLSTLIEAHIPIDRALSILDSTSSKHEVSDLITSLRRNIKEGDSLEKAMRHHPKLFSPLYLSIIQAGEAAGILEQLLPQLANFLEQREANRKELISALTYPAILLSVGALSVVMMLLYIVPQFSSLFEGATPPPSAALLLELGEWIRQWGWILLSLPIIIYFSWMQASQSHRLHLKRDQFLLSLPLIGSLLQESETSRFCQTLSVLLKADIALLSALEITHSSLGNYYLKQGLADAIKQIRSGEGLGNAIAQSQAFPAILSQFITVGEESGSIAAILTTLSKQLDRGVKTQTSRLISLLEPITILIIGTVVGGIVIIMLNAIFSINDIQL
ncbi:MAG: type II secretion system F family protein [Gammaproteobacteria bacterium]|nr:type II secretion system F family protein [Gammaproteobacteria bacterium]MBT4129350.1 type II secretion system F family protein [Candidatus Neomarinimicrobiota bacterium]MBT5373027.1 type II secretion system F family protein [Gammaproteobacteria bacterium]